MKTSDRAPGTYTLWGAAHSLFSGKIRSYLIKKRIPYRELCPAHPEFHARILPEVRMLVVPVLETPDGRILQDTTDMIDQLEAALPQPQVIPQTPVQRVVAWLLGAYGSEGLVQAAMHYRWSYRAQQENFLRAEFGRAVHSGPDRTARLDAGGQLMDVFHAYLPWLGVTQEAIPTIEAAYEDLLEILDVHFQHCPYLLGGRPSIADFGFIAPLFGHLARDPLPSTLMKNRAPNVYRWTERMNHAAIADGEFPDCPETYPPGDSIPPTIEPLLELIFRDWGAELLANAALFDEWVRSNPSLTAGSLVSLTPERKVHPTLGPIRYRVRGHLMSRGSAPQGLWHFERAAALARDLSGEARMRLDAVLKRTGGEQIMAITLARPIERKDYVLVLG